MESNTSAFFTIERSETGNVQFLFAARAVMPDMYTPGTPAHLEALTEKRPLFIPETALTAINVEKWTSQIMVMTATGMTDEFIFCVPLGMHNQVGVKLMAASRNVMVCVHKASLILYYGDQKSKFSQFFSLYGVIH